MGGEKTRDLGRCLEAIAQAQEGSSQSRSGSTFLLYTSSLLREVKEGEDRGLCPGFRHVGWTMPSTSRLLRSRSESRNSVSPRRVVKSQEVLESSEKCELLDGMVRRI